MIVNLLQASCWEGWDPGAHKAVGPLSTGLARQRHIAGEPYSVLLESGGHPLVCIDLALQALHFRVSFFDRERRRALRVDYRRLEEGRLALRDGEEWQYTDAAQAEFHKDAPRCAFQVSSPDKWSRQMIYTSTPAAAEPSQYWIDVPHFGEWGRCIAGDLRFGMVVTGHEVVAAVPVEDVSAPDGAGLPTGMRPWQPPQPLQPEHMPWLFMAGERFRIRGLGNPVVLVETQPAGTLHMPSGQLIATDPAWLQYDGTEPFRVTVPPGEYPVSLSVVRFLDNPKYPRVAAAKLAIRDAPVACWELALVAGQDPRVLGDKELFGFDVDSGVGCFLDAESRADLLQIIKRRIFVDNICGELRHAVSGANLIAYRSGMGDGTYPTWIGRDSQGAVACFVSDMLILSVADPI